VAKYDKVIPPGQEGTIHMVIEGKKVHGSFSKSATISSNDPERPTMTVSIAGQIIPYVSVKPAGQLYLQGQYGDKVQKTITVTSNEEDLDFRITKVESNMDDKITYDFARSDTEDGAWVVNVWKNPRLPTMNTYGSLFIHTNSKNASTKTIQCRVITKGAITIEPKAVNFGTIKFGMNGEKAEPVTKNVVVLKSKGEFEIQDVEFNIPGFTAEWGPVQEGKRYNIKVTFQPPEKKKPKQTHIGEMTVKTNDPREPELRVKLVARSR
jgi:hypothetical protein